jgi:hypothetical protein
LRLENQRPSYKNVCIEKSVHEGREPFSAVPEEHHDRWRYRMFTSSKIDSPQPSSLALPRRLWQVATGENIQGDLTLARWGNASAHPAVGGRYDASAAHNGNGGKAYGLAAAERHKHRSPR